MSNSICIFHNGNRRIVGYYKEKFSDLEFQGNWACNEYKDNSLYEIYYADANSKTLEKLREHNVYTIRHISDYHNDVEYPMPEVEKVMDFDSWVNNAIIPNLCYADKIVSDFNYDTQKDNIHAVITIGRTANRHYRLYLKSQNQNPKEIKLDGNNYLKYHDFLNSSEATLVWREESWETFASWWIAFYGNEDRATHNINGKIEGVMPYKNISIDFDFMQHNWVNLIKRSFDLALFYKFVLRKPITAKSTEYLIKNYKSSSKKLSYNKRDHLTNYDEAEEYYKKYIDKKLYLLYNNTVNLLKDTQ